jgi:hypothetical protein
MHEGTGDTMQQGCHESCTSCTPSLDAWEATQVRLIPGLLQFPKGHLFLCLSMLFMHLAAVLAALHLLR